LGIALAVSAMMGSFVHSGLLQQIPLHIKLHWVTTSLAGVI
jgi:hypothetical protein